MPERKLTYATACLIRQRWPQSMRYSNSWIIKELGLFCSEAVISKIRQGVSYQKRIQPRCRPKVLDTHFKRRQARNLIKTGKSIAWVAVYFNCSVSTIQKTLAESKHEK